MPHRREVPVTVKCEGKILGIFKMDFVVGKNISNFIIVEFKTVPYLSDEHEKQVLLYLTSTNIKLAILANMRVYPLQYKRIVNPNIDKLPH